MPSIRVAKAQVNDLDSKRLDTALAKLRALKEQKAQLESELSEHESYVVDLFRTQGRKTYSSGNDRATLVQGTRLVINEPGLAKALGARVWNKITKKVLDKGELEKFVALGEIKPDLVSLHSETVPNKPYVRISKQETNE